MESGTFDYISGLLQDLMQDWDLPEPPTPDSRLFTDLGLQSLEAVVLATKIQDHYGQSMPFAELFAELGRTQQDLTVRGLAEFVDKHLQVKEEAR